MNTLETVQVPAQITEKWQEIIDLLAEVLHVPSALIMKVEPPNIRVFVRSKSDGNPYERDERACLNTGLYCETVMKTRQLLLVPDALADQEWNANPDIKLGMISYMGVPVAWPNGDIFGTICVLDGKQNEYSELYRKLLFQCRDVLQADLKLLQASTELELKVLERTAELRRSEVYLTEAQRLSRTGSFSWNVSSGKILWSEECSRIYGYDKASSVTVDTILQRTHPEDLALAQRTIDRASSDGNDFEYEHRLLMPNGAVKHVHVAAHAIRDQADQLEFIGALIDITAAKRAEQELHKAQTELAHATRVTALGELTGSIAHEVYQPLDAIAANAAAALRFLDRENPDLGEARDALQRIIMDGNAAVVRVMAHEQSVRVLVEAAPSGMLVVDDQGTIKWVNTSIERLFGYKRLDLLGQSVEVLVPHRQIDNHLKLRNSFLQKPEARAMGAGRDLSGRRKDGSEFPVEIGLSPIERNGKHGVLATVIDISERKRAEERQSVLVAELDHRVKNVLARVAAVATSTRQGSSSMDEFVQTLDGRIQSMATAHSILSQNRWQGAGLADLVRNQLAPYATDANMTIGGSDVMLTAVATQALAMVFHELVTNAAKHGALSTPGGHVSVSWDRRPNGDAAAKLIIVWRELGGPPVAAATQYGYGTTLIRDLIPHELGGTVDLVLASDGARCSIEIPLERE